MLYKNHNCELTCKKVFAMKNYYYYDCSSNIKKTILTNPHSNKKQNKKHFSCRNCNKYPSFGEPPSGRPIYCVSHKPKHFINVRSIKCKYNNCTKQSTFGLINNKPIYCLIHKPSNEYINLRSKRCIICNKSRPSYGFTHNIPLYCFIDKPYNAINVTNQKCNFKTCNINASFGKKDAFLEYCSKHIPDDTYINLKHNK